MTRLNGRNRIPLYGVHNASRFHHDYVNILNKKDIDFPTNLNDNKSAPQKKHYGQKKMKEDSTKTNFQTFTFL